MTLLPNTMPVGILYMAFRFVKDTYDTTINQNTESMTQIQLKTTDPSAGGVGGQDVRAYKILQRRHGPHFLEPRTNQPWW